MPSSSSFSGLSATEALRRLQADGPNELRQDSGPGWGSLLLSQFDSPLVWLLLLACGVSAALGELLDAGAIAAILLLNAGVGFLQEYRAERSLQALRRLTAPQASVVRDGKTLTVPAKEVVVGDLLSLSAGDLVAADALLLDAHALRVQEATLTGESEASEKSTQAPPTGAPLAAQRNRVFMGTAVAAGTGLARVEAVGMRTELGRIATLVATAEERETPLSVSLRELGRRLMGICLGLVVLVAVIDLLRGKALLELLLSAVSLAVAAVPEGLPAVVTIALAVGVRRMAQRKVLVRRLAAVETLGSATVICTDKTGTLTTGVMGLRELWGPDPAALLEAAVACVDAELEHVEHAGVGDPTEIAILREGLKKGVERSAIEAANPRRSVEPFDTLTRRMSVLRADGLRYTKGAMESVVPLCTTVLEGADRAALEMAERGLRVLAVAKGPGVEGGQLVLLGLLGLADPPRPEATDAVAKARRAGILTVMITGDHPATATAIARELGILQPGQAPEGLVHARATPEDKLKLVRAWKARGAVVGMTGDGVNDAPALKEADIGIAMGVTGTEVAKASSDIVLADDNFASIVSAVAEGRAVYQNIRRALVYLLAGNFAELCVVLIAALLGWPAVLLPLHLLWINLVTDSLPAIALVLEESTPALLRRSPRPREEPVLGWPQGRQLMLTGLLEATLVLAVFQSFLPFRGLEAARDLAFNVLVCSELLRSFSARDSRVPFWRLPLSGSLRLLAVLAFSLILQWALHQLPTVQMALQTSPLAPADLGLAFLLGMIPLTVMECLKLARAKVA